MECSICNKEFKTIQGLRGHQQFKHDGQQERDSFWESLGFKGDSEPTHADPDAWSTKSIGHSQETEARWRQLFKSERGKVAEQGHLISRMNDDLERVLDKLGLKPMPGHGQGVQERLESLVKYLESGAIHSAACVERESEKSMVTATQYFMAIPGVAELQECFERHRQRLLQEGYGAQFALSKAVDYTGLYAKSGLTVDIERDEALEREIGNLIPPSVKGDSGRPANAWEAAAIDLAPDHNHQGAIRRSGFFG